jgi:hypothetical protein
MVAAYTRTMRTARPLPFLGEGRLAEMFHQRGRDPEVLDALNAELKRRDSDAAFELHLRVVPARAYAVADIGRPRGVTPEPVHDW